MPSGPDTTVVIVTRNRRDDLLSSLERTASLPGQPPIVVVDNASDDGTVAALRAEHPEVEVIPLPANVGAAARNAGVRRAATPLVAFNDDDSWWEPEALQRSAALFGANPSLGLLAARVILEPSGTEDPTCPLMRESPLRVRLGDPAGDGPHRSERTFPSVVGFLGCGAVVRRHAFVAVGGFAHGLGIGGEEQSLSLALAAAGWQLVYADQVVAHHHPSSVRNPAARRRRLVRNELWTACAYRRWPAVARIGARTIARSLWRPADRRGLGDAVAALPSALGRRRVVPGWLDEAAEVVASSAATGV